MQEDHDPNVDPNMVDLAIPPPIKADLYCRACGQIYRHNRCLQESLDIKKRFGTKYLLKRFNLSVFVMNVVNVLLVYQGITRTTYTQADLYYYLDE